MTKEKAQEQLEKVRAVIKQKTVELSQHQNALAQLQGAESTLIAIVEGKPVLIENTPEAPEKQEPKTEDKK